jgi:hypothetical protein
MHSHVAHYISNLHFAHFSYEVGKFQSLNASFIPNFVYFKEPNLQKEKKNKENIFEQRDMA